VTTTQTDGSTRTPFAAAGPGTAASPLDGAGDPGIDISVVMPCLDEEESVAECVQRAFEGIARSGRTGEVVVVDNGSTDRSVERAEAAGARVVHQARKGYGNAYRAGFAAARGRWIVMGDSDGTYDFSKLDELVAKLAEGYDTVLGSRFDGTILPGAMPWTHRYIGNPVLTRVLNVFFGLDTSDAHSGMRAFTREAIDRMELRCGGMELASEIVIKGARADLKRAEIPITYHPRAGVSKLKSLRDGWRHLRFMLLLAPRHLFLLPGIVLFLLGMVGQSVLVAGFVDIGSHGVAAAFSALGAGVALLGSQAILFGLFATTYAVVLGLERPGRVSDFVLEEFHLERGLVASLLLGAGGLVTTVYVVATWSSSDLAVDQLVAQDLFGLTLLVLGAQGLFASFFLSLLRMRAHAPGALEEAVF
jgi:hypothetical protein